MRERAISESNPSADSGRNIRGRVRDVQFGGAWLDSLTDMLKTQFDMLMIAGFPAE
ncbi:MAG TPA: hypothetical protein VEX37_13050 [Thermomicrobiales bacterium]|nr:hypothetical protein [Thermomicrobiales bacterium]